MITSSQISLFQDSSRQVSTLDASQLRVRQSGSAPGQAVDQGTELSVFRQAAYRYSAREQMAFSSSGEVSGDGRTQSFTTEQLLERSSDLLLVGQQAMRVSRAALGGEAPVETPQSLSVSASRYMFYSESESRSFASSGSITLDDGNTIDFTLSLRQSQSRSYQYSENVQIRERPMSDPLVINFGAATARLTDTLFEFDMTGNGETESFAALGAGSGYLVFDRNGNGKVDDGSELFGPGSGSGFGELARYDDDGNRWIDEGDEVFDSLSVWVQTADGGEELRSLAEVGVQALYLDSVQDSFTLANSQGVPLGQIRSSGIYLTTGGEVRTLEELDLAAQDLAADTPEEAVPAMVESLPEPAGRVDPVTNGLVEARVEAIRGALEKLNSIREEQKAFIKASREEGKATSPLDHYLKVIDKLRLALLNSQDEKKQAASRYLEFARS
ncbi:hypothetical protein [Marinobacter oulmenensis]|uniref:VCBS repeat-containing protein n=1 Tax=Marinobacter oulmenensis TaxID=643747 RepID=A0A840UI57_9GAMM|nr:hypothetical protein [Marinobacter oulmenensis]MBB5322005.1 hypothetical protein [Marinobacter oulmenensis]